MIHSNSKGKRELFRRRDGVPRPTQTQMVDRLITFYQCFLEAVSSMHVLYFLHHAAQNILRSRIIDRFVNNSLMSGER